MDDNIQPRTSRLDNLHADRGTTAQNINQGYSRFIRKVQIALPIVALLLIIVIFGWNRFEGDKIVPIKQEDIQPEIRQEIGKNELVNPRFESIDTKGQPFTLTADKAIQDNNDDNGEMLLENPSGTMALKSGDNVTISSNKGAYQQIKQYLDLNENVVLAHSQGYELKTQTLHVDLSANKAWSNEAVRVTGPEGEINAKGIEASSDTEIIIFKGPAKMLLTLEKDAMNFGEMLP